MRTSVLPARELVQPVRKPAVQHRRTAAVNDDVPRIAARVRAVAKHRADGAVAHAQATALQDQFRVRRNEDRRTDVVGTGRHDRRAPRVRVDDALDVRLRRIGPVWRNDGVREQGLLRARQAFQELRLAAREARPAVRVPEHFLQARRTRHLDGLVGTRHQPAPVRMVEHVRPPVGQREDLAVVAGPVDLVPFRRRKDPLVTPRRRRLARMVDEHAVQRARPDDVDGIRPFVVVTRRAEQVPPAAAAEKIPALDAVRRDARQPRARQRTQSVRRQPPPMDAADGARKEPDVAARVHDDLRIDAQVGDARPFRTPHEALKGEWPFRPLRRERRDAVFLGRFHDRAVQEPASADLHDVGRPERRRGRPLRRLAPLLLGDGRAPEARPVDEIGARERVLQAGRRRIPALAVRPDCRVGPVAPDNGILEARAFGRLPDHGFRRRGIDRLARRPPVRQSDRFLQQRRRADHPQGAGRIADLERDGRQRLSRRHGEDAREDAHRLRRVALTVGANCVRATRAHPPVRDVRPRNDGHNVRGAVRKRKTDDPMRRAGTRRAPRRMEQGQRAGVCPHGDGNRRPARRAAESLRRQ